MSHHGNEQCMEQAYEELVEQYMREGYTEEEAKEKADWFIEEPQHYSQLDYDPYDMYDGYHIEGSEI
jgi:hypothetical protein